MGFGKMLRAYREAARVSMGALARQLEISVTYLSDVERETRAPLSPERIQAASRFMRLGKEEEDQLLKAAQEHRGVVELGANHLTPKGWEASTALMRGWPKYTDRQFEKLADFLRVLEEEDDAGAK